MALTWRRKSGDFRYESALVAELATVPSSRNRVHYFPSRRQSIERRCSRHPDSTRRTREHQAATGWRAKTEPTQVTSSPAAAGATSGYFARSVRHFFASFGLFVAVYNSISRSRASGRCGCLPCSGIRLLAWPSSLRNRPAAAARLRHTSSGPAVPRRASTEVLNVRQSSGSAFSRMVRHSRRRGSASAKAFASSSARLMLANCWDSCGLPSGSSCLAGCRGRGEFVDQFAHVSPSVGLSVGR